MRIRTGYSFRTAIGHLPEVMSRLVEIGATCAPITDRCSTFGFNRWAKAASKVGLRPVFGVELAVVPKFESKKPVTDYWTFLALDSLRPLHDLIWRATDNPGKEPCLTYAQALAAPGVAVITGERLLLDHVSEPVSDRFWVGLSPSTPVGLFRRAQARGLPFLAVSDNFYPRAEDKELYRVTLGWRSGTQTYPQYILSDQEWLAATAHLGQQDEALRNRDALAERCRATMRKARLLVPEKPKSLRELCLEGAQRKGCDLSDPVYAERLERELALIADKEFEDYFFILADIIGWAKQRMIVGPGRGSSAGSLVCYLLDITAIDPIPYGLLFERFLDVNRDSLPDVDIDFADTRRSLVFEYVKKRYGAAHVARLGTVGMFQPRSALKQAGAALRVPGWRISKVSDLADTRALKDTLAETDPGRALLREHPELQIAVRMEGHPNNASQHAAGVLLTEEPIAEYVAVDWRTKAAWCDKEDSEDLNLLKIDALGLTQLSIFERTLELIGEEPQSGFLERLPLDDQEAFEVLNKGHLSGIFQFTGNAVRSLAAQIHYSSLEDLIATTALARPGPLAAGGAHSWVRRKRGDETVTTLHPMLTELTKETYGVVIYQEQVMRIVREIGQVSWGDTSAIRKAMSASLGGEVFEGYWRKFKVGAVFNGLHEDTARSIWEQVNTFGAYSFNKSHAVAYAIVSYWCCWFKAHHPVEFAAATLDAEVDPAKQLLVLRELKSEGVDYIPVDPDHSIDRWVPVTKDDGRRLLVGPLTAIKGIGPAKVREVLDCRKSGAPVRPVLRKQLENARTELDSLFPVQDAIKRLHPDLNAINIATQPLPISEVQCGEVHEALVLGVIRRITPKDENEETQVAKRGFALTGPTQTLGMFFGDDSGEIYCKVNRGDFERLGRPLLEKARAGKSLYAIKGTVPRGFRMISVNLMRYLGELDG